MKRVVVREYFFIGMVYQSCDEHRKEKLKLIGFSVF